MLPRHLNTDPAKSADAIEKLRRAMAKVRAEDPEKYNYKMDEMRQDAARGDPEEPCDDEE